MALDILIVDDEADIRLLVGEILTDEGYECRQAGDADGALKAIEERRPSLVVLDIWLRGSRLDGLQILDILRRDHPSVPVLMISGHGTIETAVSAIKKGAYDFIEKPFKADRLIMLVERAIDAARLRREVADLRRRFGGDEELIGVSPCIAQLRAAIERVAPTDSRVLITGPPGSGKEVVARMVHARSRRSAGAFVTLNCATMSPDRVELELFGVETGGADADRGRMIGTFEQAHGGTLLLDEVSDMPPETQGKIVRVLQDQTFVRVGGTTKVNVDVRVVATSNRDLHQEMAAGRFRPDLYYRLNVVPLAVPPLAGRREDIPILLDRFMSRVAEAAGMAPRALAADAVATLQSYDWPGNVRQLRNMVERILIMAPGGPADPVRADMLPYEINEAGPELLRWNGGGEVMTLPLRDAREVFERQYLAAQVVRFGGNISRTASFVGMERSALHRKLKLLGVEAALRLDKSAG
jgi:two-component system nitrogen regulation response regulator NtrX